MNNISIKNDANIPKISLILLSLVFSIILMLLDFSFHAPRISLVESIIKVLYSISIGIILFVLANRSIPDLIDKVPVVKDRYFHLLISGAIILLSLILALDIKTTGGLPSSPYSSFLSSFPVFCIVMMFGSITFKTCIKAIILIASILLLVEIVDMILFYCADCTIVHSKVNEFIESDINIKLSSLVLLVTIVSNILSILLAQQVVPPDAENGSR